MDDKLSKARCRLLSCEPWYGAFSILFDWKPTTPDVCATMGVRFGANCRVECLYNPEFVDSRSIEQLYATVKHEIEHIVRMHPARLGDQRHPKIWNLATDMCINGKRSKPTCVYTEATHVVLPFEDMVFIPEDWSDDESSEVYYDKIPKTCPQCGGSLTDESDQGGGGGQGEDDSDGDGDGDGQSSGDGDGDGDGQSGGQDENQDQGEGQGDDEQGGSGGQGDDKEGEGGGNKGQCKCGYGRLVDDHDLWRSSAVSEDEARQVVKNMAEQAKARGTAPAHLTEALQDLNDPVVRWREIIRQFLGKHAGGRRMTWSRRNRRRDEFGIKGVSHHATSKLGVIIDTSGSICSDELKQFFAEIEAISYRAKTWILQWDAGFQDYAAKYRRGDWKNIQIKGRGGTDMAAAVQWVVDNKVQADAVVLLTDGYTPWPEKTPFPMIFCVTDENQVENAPEWGTRCHVKAK